MKMRTLKYQVLVRRQDNCPDWLANAPREGFFYFDADDADFFDFTMDYCRKIQAAQCEVGNDNDTTINEKIEVIKDKQ